MPKSSRGTLLKVVIVLGVLLAAGLWTFQRLRTTARVKLVNRGLASDAVTGSVSVRAFEGYKEVKSEAAGKVVDAKAIKVDSPFTVAAPLVQLDTTELDRQISEFDREFISKQARLKLELEGRDDEKLAETNLATAIRLFDLGTFSDQQKQTAQRTLDEIRKKLKLAEFDREKAEADHKAMMETFKLQKEKMTVKAPPIDGVVQTPMTFEGALIQATSTVAIVYSNARIVAARISEESIGKVKIGQKARLRLLSYGSRSFEAKVSKLLPTADDAQRFEVWLDVDVEDPKMLNPGSTGEVTITVEERPNQVVILRRALFGGDKVWVVKNGRVERRQVKIGFDSSLNVLEILEGLEVGELVIVDRLDEFYQGQRVQVEVVN